MNYLIAFLIGLLAGVASTLYVASRIRKKTKKRIPNRVTSEEILRKVDSRGEVLTEEMEDFNEVIDSLPIKEKKEQYVTRLEELKRRKENG
jgi:hypothetical protein